MTAISTSGHPALRRTRTGCPLDAKQCKWHVIGVRCAAPIGTNEIWRAIWLRWLDLGRGRSSGRHFGEVTARPAPQDRRRVRRLATLSVTDVFALMTALLDHTEQFKKLKAGLLGTAALQGYGDRGRKERGPPIFMGLFPPSARSNSSHKAHQARPKRCPIGQYCLLRVRENNSNLCVCAHHTSITASPDEPPLWAQPRPQAATL